MLYIRWLLSISFSFVQNNSAYVFASGQPSREQNDDIRRNDIQAAISVGEDVVHLGKRGED